MADKVYKIKDVPKGERLKFVFDYYKVHMAVVLLVVVFFAIGIYEMTHIPKFDVKMTLFAKDLKVSETVLRNFEEKLKELPLDLNEDGQVDIYITPIIKNVLESGASAEFNELAYAELTIGDSVIMITDADIYNDFILPRSVLLKNSELGLDGEGTARIPYEKTVFNDYLEEEYFGRDMFVIVKTGDFNDEKYQRQIEAFKNIILK